MLKNLFKFCLGLIMLLLIMVPMASTSLANETIATNDKIVFKINDTNYYTQTVGSEVVNDKTEPIDVAPMITNSRTMLPARLVAEGLGFKVDWDGNPKVQRMDDGYTTTYELAPGGQAYDIKLAKGMVVTFDVYEKINGVEVKVDTIVETL